MDESRINEIILKHLKLAFSIATRYKGVNHDELIDIALYTLTTEVHNFYKLIDRDENVTRYISSRIRFRIIDYLRGKKFEVTISNWDDFIGKSNQELILEVHDTIEKCCKNDLDKFIFDCKLKGMSDLEISDLSGESRMQINRIRNILYSRFRVYWTDFKDYGREI